MTVTMSEQQSGHISDSLLMSVEFLERSVAKRHQNNLSQRPLRL